jgi:hypothetical protein
VFGGCGELGKLAAVRLPGRVDGLAAGPAGAAGDDCPPFRFADPAGEHLIVAAAEQRSQERLTDATI